MFTLLVSWLLAACVPGLLVLATLGLGRLERALARDKTSATNVGEFLDQAEVLDVHTLAREGMPEALEYLHRRQDRQLAHAPPVGTHHAEPYLAANLAGPGYLSLSTSAARQTRVNPEFLAIRHVNRV